MAVLPVWGALTRPLVVVALGCLVGTTRGWASMSAGQQQGPLSGKTALVTGSTDGIGQHTAARLAAAGARVLVHGRRRERVDAAVARVKEQSGSDQVRGILADISTLAGMRALCEAAERELSAGGSGGEAALDILVSNAGVFEHNRQLTADGIELVFATNVLAPYVTTGLLLPLLRRAASSGRGGARVVTVSSISQGYAAGLDDPQFEGGGYSDHKSYSLSKLCDAMLSMELHARFGSPTLTFNTLDPGTVNTKMLNAGWGMCGIPISRANDQFKLASDPSLQGASGGYYVGGRESRANAAAYDAPARKKLWDYCARLSGFEY